MVTGATGFVGQALCRRLIKENWELRLLLRSSAKIACLPAELRANSILGNMLDSDSLEEACAGIDTILHLAAVAHVGDISEQLSEDNNLVGTENLLQAALNQQVSRIVFLSSSLAQAAELSTGDVTAYGRGKLAAEVVLTKAGDRKQIEVVILRPVNVYGVGMKGNIAGMISMIKSGSLPRLPALLSRISLLGVEDLAEALVLAAKSPEAAGKIYTLTDGQVYSISEIEIAIYEVLGKPLPNWRTPAMLLYMASAVAGLLSKLGLRDSSISTRTYRNLKSDNVFENDKICRELGFKPQEDLFTALPIIVEKL